MNIEKTETKGCCGKTSLFFKLSKPITQDIANAIIKLGFIQQDHFTKAGICSLINNQISITGPFHSKKLQLKCRVKDCSNIIENIINVLNEL